MRVLNKAERKKIERILFGPQKEESNGEYLVRVSCGLMYLFGIRSCEAGDATYRKLSGVSTPVLLVSETNIETRSVPRIIPVCKTIQERVAQLGMEYNSSVPLAPVPNIEKTSDAILEKIMSESKLRRYRAEWESSGECSCVSEYVFRENIKSILEDAELGSKDIAYFLGTRKLTAIGYRSAPVRERIAKKMDAAMIADN